MNIYDSALRRLSAQPRTEFELRKYLNDKGFMNSEIDDVISEFLSCGYLDDAAFCADYFRYAFGKGWGRKRIVSELKKKGVDAEVIQNAFADYEEENPVDERTIARQEAEKILRITLERAWRAGAGAVTKLHVSQQEGRNENEQNKH